LCAVLLLWARPAAAQAVDDSLRADIEKLMQVTGAAQLGSQVANAVAGQVLAGLKQAQPNIPDRVLVIAREVLDKEFAELFSGPQSMLHELVPVYAKHFTHEDIRGMLAFYDSPLGKKMIQSMPAVAQDSMAVGQRWAQTAMPRVQAVLQERLRAEGLIK
jgi:uncharacterized protein